MDSAVGERPSNDRGRAVWTRRVAFVFAYAVALLANGCSDSKGAGPGATVGSTADANVPDAVAVNPGDAAGSPPVNVPDAGTANGLVDAADSRCDSGDGGRCTKAIAIAASEEFACAVLSGGTVECWGANDDWANLTGIPTATITSSPLAVTGLTGATAVALAFNSGCAVIADGTVQCWGIDTSNQLAGSSSSLTPVTVMGLGDAVAIAAGEYGYCALRSGGTVSCWGPTLLYMSGSEIDASTPPLTAVDIPGIAGAQAISAKGYAACAAFAQGAGECWGEYFVWGGIDYPMPLSATVWASSPLTGAITQIAAPESFVCALDSDGTVACWGSNSYGQLGNGTQTDTRGPTTLVDIDHVTAIASGYDTVCAVTAGGTVSCWGDNRSGQLGGGSTGMLSATPVGVPGLTGAVDVALGLAFGCALLADGSVKCWGSIAVNDSPAMILAAPTTVPF
jgi:alpha-tubulin suppressor-like RCC1 family protein